jgi:hypothetical protein
LVFGWFYSVGKQMLLQRLSNTKRRQSERIAIDIGAEAAD